MHIVQKENDHFWVKLEDETGVGTIDIYHVFPGIYLGYSDFRLQKCQSDFLGQSEMIGVEHCREGKIEWELKNGDFAYLGSGSLISCCYGKNEGYFEFPNHSYQGLSFAMELPLAIEGLPYNFPVNLSKLQERIMTAGALDLSKHTQSAHVLGVVYEAQKRSDLHRKLACLEFLLLLDELQWSENSAKPLYFPRSLVKKMKEIEFFLTSHLDHRYTLEELSDLFSLSVSTIRRCFSGIFGYSVAAYMKKHRMDEAMRRLSNTDDQISQIASALGYENASKFSAAFRAHTNISPQMYRAQFR